MKIRLSDFAEINRINVRTAQIHIKENIEELEAHIERRGKQGTWIDEFAQEFLLQKIQLPSKEEVYIPSAREAALLDEIIKTNKLLADAERAARVNAEAAGQVKLLEESKKEQAEKIEALTRENAILNADNKEKNKTLAELDKTAQGLSEELLGVKEDFKNLKERNKITETNLKTVQDRLGEIQSKWWYKLFAGKK